ncbi:hypothetical protein DPMN_015193 [Dreissena polymorpha]|uniref:Uncharacterized protein n=1 Tax=Dreissena polymorpha TaxID=45954 RepID=A0A9D4S3E8_DREPO|nr:hypothetical protein DPMN_015193 [Dreissena polymorpha]
MCYASVHGRSLQHVLLQAYLREFTLIQSRTQSRFRCKTLQQSQTRSAQGELRISFSSDN